MTRARTFRPSRWALILLLAAGVAVAADLFLPAGPFPPNEHRAILIQRGQSLRQIGEELHRVGILRGTLGFHVLARAMHLDRSIKAGQYSFRVGITVPALLRSLARGMSGLNLVTIPEGLTMSEVSLLLSNHLGVPVAEFDSLGHDKAFLDSLAIPAPSLEGYLAPDSYEFLPGTSPEVAFRTMVKRTQESLLRAAAGRDSLPLGLSLLQVLTLASIVEAEAQVDDERPRIARVYLNRLAKGMRLQADPTVGYALGTGPRTRLSLRQLRVQSPFNTYLYEGLPPGPICNPGRESIQAVIDPLPDVKDLFFVARGEGRHLFSQTYEQHLANIRLVRSRQPAESDSVAAAVEPGPARADSTAKRAKGAAVAQAVTTPPAASGKTSAAKPTVTTTKTVTAPAKTTVTPAKTATTSAKTTAPKADSSAKATPAKKKPKSKPRPPSGTGPN